MNTYTIYEAKTNFSQLVRRAAAGEKIYIGSHGKPAVELVAVSNVPEPKSLKGIWEGQFRLPDDWDELDEQVTEMMVSSDLGVE